MDQSFVYWATTAAAVIFLSWMTMLSARKFRSVEKYLCTDCRFNNPVDCQKIDRPYALLCTSYRGVKKMTKEQK